MSKSAKLQFSCPSTNISGQMLGSVADAYRFPAIPASSAVCLARLCALTNFYIHPYTGRASGATALSQISANFKKKATLTLCQQEPEFGAEFSKRV
jgi:hypothetical protein